MKKAPHAVPTPIAPDPPPEVLDMAVEETMGKPTRHSPEQGIAAMQARFKHFTDQKASLLEASEAGQRSVVSALSVLNGDLREAKARLAEYQAQLKGKN